MVAPAKSDMDNGDIGERFFTAIDEAIAKTRFTNRGTHSAAHLIAAVAGVFHQFGMLRYDEDFSFFGEVVDGYLSA